MNRTYVAKPDTIERKWYVVDAANMPIGRLAVEVSKILRGKNKPTFSYHVDTGDFVVVVNADKAIWTGTKGKELIYWHTGWPGGIKNISREDMLVSKPERLIEKVVWGMMPKGPLGRAMIKKLKVYAGPEHPHTAQNPTAIKLGK